MKVFAKLIPAERAHRLTEQHRYSEVRHWATQNRIGRMQNRIGIVAVFLSLIAAVGAVVAAIFAGGAYIQAKRQADAAEGQLSEVMNSDRAVVGVIDASFKAFPKIGADNQIMFSQINTGNEPATNINFSIDQPFSTTDMNNADVVNELNSRAHNCVTRSVSDKGGAIILPGKVPDNQLGSGTGHTLRTKVFGDLITQRLVDGNDNLVFTGCLVYQTNRKPHHYAFCYFWQGDTDTWQHLNICLSGGTDAD